MTGGPGVRLLLDQGVPRDAANRLRELGFSCSHVAEIGMWKAADAEILARSSDENAVIVTLDADFHAILAVSGASGPSVVRLRMEGLSAAKVVELIRVLLDQFEADLRRGALVTAKAKKITCHRLPIGVVD